MEDEVRAILDIDATELQRTAFEFIEEYKTNETVKEKGAALAMYFLKINGWVK